MRRAGEAPAGRRYGSPPPEAYGRSRPAPPPGGARPGARPAGPGSARSGGTRPGGTVPWSAGSDWDSFFTGSGGPAGPPQTGAEVAKALLDIVRRKFGGR